MTSLSTRFLGQPKLTKPIFKACIPNGGDDFRIALESRCSVASRAEARVAVRANRAKRGIGVWVTAREAFWIALEALRSHKLRSFLTLLGVVIATTTLIVVMSIVNGMNVYIADHIANLGTNTFVLHQFQWAQGFDSFLKARRRNQPIRMEDYEYLEENLQGYQHISAIAQLNPIPSALPGALDRRDQLDG